MIYELRVYEAAPGKMAALQARFRDHTLEIFERHGIKNVGYWTASVGDWNDKLIYIVAFEDEGQRGRAWASFRDDPEWQRGAGRVRGGRRADHAHHQRPVGTHGLLAAPVMSLPP